MMFTRLILFVVVFGPIASCKKSDDKPALYPKGQYHGTFQRMHIESSQVASVTLDFDFPYWTGTSSIPKYPALANGTFRYKDDALEFTNRSPWTADFDWTLILDGMYLEQRGGDSLLFTKSYGNGWVDVYKLKKVK
ncbi:hypothetical protein [Flavihumibacter solisilvae]|nr:hypothetical protein [Flavihumibacter solisilvae]